MFKAGEFAASEVSLAVKTSKFITQRTIAMTRRVQSEAPDVWDAWEHGDIDNDKVVRVNRALRRLVHDRSKALLNTLVVPVAIEKTPEILGRWLNQFIAEVEPNETDERLRRAFETVTSLSARTSTGSASCTRRCPRSTPSRSIRSSTRSPPSPNQTTNAPNNNAAPTPWSTCSAGESATAGTPTSTPTPTPTTTSTTTHPTPPGTTRPAATPRFAPPDHDDDMATSRDPSAGPTRSRDLVHGGAGAEANSTDAQGHGNCAEGMATAPRVMAPGQGKRQRRRPRRACHGCQRHRAHRRPGHGNCVEGNGSGAGQTATALAAAGPHRSQRHRTRRSPPRIPNDRTGPDWAAHDWELPASAFRPDPPHPRTHPHHQPARRHRWLDPDAGVDPPGLGPHDQRVRNRPTAPTCCHRRRRHHRESLFGYSNMPGQLIDRSSLVPADTIRDLAQQPGTLFYRLLTDDAGKLLDVTELGRFPSRKLDTAVKFRDRHLRPTQLPPPRRPLRPGPSDPVPEAHHRQQPRPRLPARPPRKTHAGHRTTRDGDVTEWTTPTGHTYTTHDQPFPVDPRPDTG